MKDAKTIIRTLAMYLEESHEEELVNSHYGDSKQSGPDAENCSYCRAIEDARLFLNGVSNG